MNGLKAKQLIKEKALSLGFSDLKVAKVSRMNKEAGRLEEWLSAGRHGKMNYMENYFEKRVDPGKLVPSAKTVMALSHNYFPAQNQNEESYKIARYAYGRDYHKVLKKKGKKLFEWISSEIEEIHGRVFVDSAPVLERDWGERAGLGWKGKNTLLIHPKRGSYFFLSEIISTLDLPADTPISDHCGTCRKCIDACPTEAIDEDGYSMDASKCISYLTIEYKDSELPEDFNGKLNSWVFGCDICQEVCPWNRFSEPHREEGFMASERKMMMDKEDWTNLSEQDFERLFYGTAVVRTKYSGLKRNIAWLEEE